MIDLSDKITIVIPTYNRYRYLKRLLKYYRSSEITLGILIADSSSSPLEDGIDCLISTPKTDYLKFSSDITLWEKCAAALEKISTEYVVICADDDFIVPSAVEDSVKFLNENTEYSVVLGLHCAHGLTKNRHGKTEFAWTQTYTKAQSIELDSPAERLKLHLLNYNLPNVYGVKRTDNLRLAYREMLDATSHGRMGEVLLSAITVIQGKRMVMPTFYSSREVGQSVDQIIDVLPYFHTPWSSFLNQDNYSTEYNRAVKCLLRNLQNQSGLSNTVAIGIVEEAIGQYLKRVRDEFKWSHKSRWPFVRLVIGISNRIGLRRVRGYAYNRMAILRNRLRENDKKPTGFNADSKLTADPNFSRDINRIREAVVEAQIHFRN